MTEKPASDVQIDPEGKIITIFGIRYAMDLFKHMGLGPLNQPFELVNRADGVVTVRHLMDREWIRIADNPPPTTDMIIWGYETTPGKWSIGLAYPNVEGGWSVAGGFAFDWAQATHWTRLPEPPRG
jgi:hypothetical protein